MILKKLFALALVSLIFFSTLYARDNRGSIIVENPKFDASTWYQIQLQSIELNDKETVLTIQMRSDYTYLSQPMNKNSNASRCRPDASSIYIENETGTQRMYVTKIKSTVVDEKDSITTARFKVYFPSIPDTWNAINYIEPFHRIAGIRYNDKQINIAANVHIIGHIDDIHPCMQSFIGISRPVEILDGKGNITSISTYESIHLDRSGKFKFAFNINKSESIDIRYMLYTKQIEVKPGSDIRYYLPLGEKVEKPSSCEVLNQIGSREMVVDLSMNSTQ